MDNVAHPAAAADPRARAAGPVTAATDPLGASHAWLQEALAAEQAGDHAAADRAIARVVELGVPAPDLLRECGEYFKRRGRVDDAFRSFATLQGRRPEAMPRFAQGLAPEQACRYLPWEVARLRQSERPGFYGFQPVKAALVRWLGVDGAAAVLSDLGLGTTPLQAQTLPFASLLDAVRRHGNHETLAASRTRRHRAPTRIGADGAGGFDATTREVFRGILADVQVCSKSNFVVADGMAVLDVQDGELARCPLNLDTDPLVLHAGGADGADVTVLLPPRGAPVRAVDRACSLLGLHTAAFGHWLLEFLPKLFAWRDVPAFAGVTLLVDAQMPRQHREALARLAPAHPVMTVEPGERVQVGRLYVASMPIYMPTGPKPGPESVPDLLAVDAAAFAAMIRGMFPDDGRAGTERIYLARKPGQHRRLVNADEVEAWFRAQGFTVVDPAGLGFGEQLDLVRSARVVVGPDGSNMFMTLFCRPGTWIRTLSHELPEDTEWFTAIGDELGLDTAILAGPIVREHVAYPLNSDYRIDVERLHANAGVLVPAAAPPLPPEPAAATAPASIAVPVMRPLLPDAARLAPYLARIDQARTYSNFGPLAIELEARLAGHFGLPDGMLVTASSGYAALVAAILAVAGRATAERPVAIVPAYTFVATAAAVEQCGYVPRLADVDADDWLLDPERAADLDGLERVGLVVPVATLGRPVPVADWERFRGRTGIPVVIDAAASFDAIAADPARHLGTLPVAVSFHATKSFSTGEGGCVVCRDRDVLETARRGVNFGFHGSRDSTVASINGKLSEYHAAIGLAELDGWPAKRAAMAAVSAHYRRLLAERGLGDRFHGGPDIGSCYAIFAARDAVESARIGAALDAGGIDHRLWYGTGLTGHAHYADAARFDLPTTRDLAPRLLGLPFAPDLPERTIRRIVATVAGAVASGGGPV